MSKVQTTNRLRIANKSRQCQHNIHRWQVFVWISQLSAIKILFVCTPCLPARPPPYPPPTHFSQYTPNRRRVGRRRREEKVQEHRNLTLRPGLGQRRVLFHIFMLCIAIFHCCCWSSGAAAAAIVTLTTNLDLVYLMALPPRFIGSQNFKCAYQNRLLWLDGQQGNGNSNSNSYIYSGISLLCLIFGLVYVFLSARILSTAIGQKWITSLYLWHSSSARDKQRLCLIEFSHWEYTSVICIIFKVALIACNICFRDFSVSKI